MSELRPCESFCQVGYPTLLGYSVQQPMMPRCRVLKPCYQASQAEARTCVEWKARVPHRLSRLLLRLLPQHHNEL